MRVYLEAIGLCGPGLDGWAASRAILKGMVPYEPRATNIPAALLPANERRRAVQTVRLALAVGAEAFAASVRDAAVTPAIFASSGGDGDTIHEILKVIASPNPEVSPTRFHNSVHNAPAGYWSIATGSRAPSNALCCYDDSFAAGLLEAAAMATTDSCAVAMIAYDVQYPEPLASVRAIGAAFAVALLLSHQPATNTFASIDMRLRSLTTQPTTVRIPELEAIRENTPAARSLPLLETLAREETAEIVLPYLSEMEFALQVCCVDARQGVAIQASGTAAR